MRLSRVPRVILWPNPTFLAASWHSSEIMFNKIRNLIRPAVPVSSELTPYVEFDRFDKYTRDKNKITATVLALAVAGKLVESDAIPSAALATALVAMPYLAVRRHTILENMDVLQPRSALNGIGNTSTREELSSLFSSAFKNAASSLVPFNLALMGVILASAESTTVMEWPLAYLGGWALAGAAVDVSMKADLRSQLPPDPDQLGGVK